METEEIRREFGASLKQLRKQKGWTQKELAGKVDVRSSQLNKYESGIQTPPVDKLLLLAEVLDTSVDYLLTGDASEDVPLHNTRLLERFRDLADFEADDQDTVIKLIDTMIVKRRVEGAVQGFVES